MPEERLPRKLAAILYADVAGYSRLTGEDEDATHRRLSEYLDLISQGVERHHGRVMHYAGDAVLAMFAAVVDALSCAAHVQRALSARNDALPEQRRVQFRIGVNLGDVIEDRGDIYGEGVNVAARLEGLAEPGGICVSESVHTAVGSKLPLEYEDIGEQVVKNIDKPLRAYRARLRPGAALPEPVEVAKSVETSGPAARRRRRVAAVAGVGVLVVVAGALLWLEPWVPREEPASVERMAYPLPEEPSIAVLPFTNMSGDPEQEYFADGLTENVITTVSQLPEVFVIARNSTFSYKGQPVEVQQVAEDLGVRYVLEGSFQRVENRVRVHAQFIDALSGRHLWAKRFDREWSDIFALQDELTERIVSSLALKLSEEQRALLSRHYTNDPEAYDDFLRGQSSFYGYSAEDNARAREMYQRAADRDPEFARAVAGVALTHAYDFRFGWSEAGQASLERAQELVRKALAMDETLPQVQLVAGAVHQFARNHAKAIEAGRRAIALDHSYADAYALVAFSETYVGNAAEAIGLMEKAMRLNPNPSSLLHVAMGRALFFSEQLDEAQRHLKRAVDLNPEFLLAHVMLTAAWSRAGNDGDAEWQAEEVLVLSPDFSVDGWLDKEPLVHEPYLEVLRDSLLRAGLPE